MPGLPDAAAAGVPLTTIVLGQPGIDVDVWGQRGDSPDLVTPLSLAASLGRVQLMRLLLDAMRLHANARAGPPPSSLGDAMKPHVADASPVPNAHAAIVAAVTAGQLESVRVLVHEHGVSLDAAAVAAGEGEGSTLALAATQPALPARFVQALLDLGAAPLRGDVLRHVCAQALDGYLCPGGAADVSADICPRPPDSPEADDLDAALMSQLLSMVGDKGLVQHDSATPGAPLNPRLAPRVLALVKVLVAAGVVTHLARWGGRRPPRYLSEYLCAHAEGRDTVTLLRLLLDAGARGGLPHALRAACKVDPTRPGHAVEDVSATVGALVGIMVEAAGGDREALALEAADSKQHRDALTLACRNGHIVAARHLLGAGSNPNFSGSFETCLNWLGTPLLSAIDGDHPGIVKLLLASGAVLDGDLYSHEARLLQLASRHGEGARAVANAEHGAGRPFCCHLSSHPVVRAAALHRLECLLVLLDAGGDPNAKDCRGVYAIDALRTPFDSPVPWGGRRSDTAYDSAPRHQTELMGKCLDLLLAHGATPGLGRYGPDSMLDPLLWASVLRGDMRTLKTLIEHQGSEIFRTHGGAYHEQCHGSLFEFAILMNQGMLEVLLRAPSTPIDKGFAILHLAACLNTPAARLHDGVVTILEAGASLDVRDAQGRTALHHLVSFHLGEVPLDRIFTGGGFVDDKVTARCVDMARRFIYSSREEVERLLDFDGRSSLEISRQAADAPLVVGCQYSELAKHRATQILQVLENGAAIRKEANIARRGPCFMMMMLCRRARAEPCLQPHHAHASLGDCLHILCDDDLPGDVALKILKLL
eukprot:jgi/Mesvir1/10581/Mv21796-RA.1